ncbi:MAG: universal stress protein [Vicinamibacterales bacterium]|nr:universal stress protein [Vicinamibacterales bacterium]
MVRINRILCPIDFSDYSRRALDHACVIARWYDATVTVLYVYMRLPPALVPPELPVRDAVRLTPAEREQVQASVARFADACNAPGRPLEIAVHEGWPAAGILAEAERADLLVMGTHGRSGFDRLALGSVTEKVLRKTACPVLTIPRQTPEAVPAAPVGFQRILCPIDFSDVSLRALEYAMSLAAGADARLTMLHVMVYDMSLEAPDLYGTVVSDRALSLDVLRERYETYARTRLEALVPDPAQATCDVETAIGHGKPSREVLRAAEERQADLIVMGATGHGALDRMFFGATTQHVVRQATCPVLTLRAP